MDWDTLRWCDHHLELLDQRQLQQQLVYLACHDATEVAQAIRQLVVRGAPAIGIAAAYGVALAAQQAAQTFPETAPAFWTQLEAQRAQLAASRPTAVNLFWALEEMRRATQTFLQPPSAAAEHTPGTMALVPSPGDKSTRSLARYLLQHAQYLHREDLRRNLALGDHGAALLPDGARVLTHCNAGALATTGHGTALGVIRSAVAAGKKISVIADETRPILQGARLTAWELQQANIPVTLITDNMAGYLMQQGQVDAVIVGADRVAANGDVVNKIGTYMVAVLAQHHRIPFYVAFPRSTLDLAVTTGAAIPIEERAAQEVTGWGTCHWAPLDVAVRNPAFDITPAALVSAWITEDGVFYQKAIPPGLDANSARHFSCLSACSTSPGVDSLRLP